MIIRKAIAGDEKALCRFDNAELKDSSPGFALFLWEHMVKKGRVYAAFSSEGQPLGFTILEPAKDGLHFTKILVGEEHRGKKIGLRLLETALAAADAEGKSTSLDVAIENTGAIALYKKFSFAVKGEEFGLLTMQREPFAHIQGRAP